MGLEVIGYIASVVIGIALGLLGGGGSILTLPVLVYLFGVAPVVATGYSLFIVGATSAVGALRYFRKGLVNLRTGILFGVPSIVAVFSTRAFILPAIPVVVFTDGNFVITKDLLLMLIFSVLMVVASFSMIKVVVPQSQNFNSTKQPPILIVLVQGILEGTITGLVGAGGGFLIIPALVILSKLPMKEAIGTSLAIISVKSLLGFLGEGSFSEINWQMLVSVSAVAISGIFVGTYISRSVDGAKLKPVFGWFIFAMGIYIITRELISNT